MLSFFPISAFENLVLIDSLSLKSPYHRFRRCTKSGKLRTNTEKKVIQVTSGRRICFVSDGTSVTYGYHQSFEKKILLNCLETFFP